MNKTERVKIDTLVPAEYNPRDISEESLDMLKQSISELGQIKPIIVNGETNVIMAGHQRTKAMRALGYDECDAYVLHGINQQDEARFNQIHNKTEYEVSDDAPRVRINKPMELGTSIIYPNEVEVLDKGRLADFNKSLATLIQRYGAFGMPICTQSGDVIVSSAYAMASKLCYEPMLVLTLDDHKAELAKSYLSKEYGRFSYDTIRRKTYIQSLAQLPRLQGRGKRRMVSKLYEQMVIPYLDAIQDGSTLRILDFGAGKYAYADKLRARGYNIERVDPYHRVAGTHRIAVADNEEAFKRIAKSISENGLYDIVICDSVLNSVDALQAWDDVVNTCHALTKDGGTIFISGRKVEDALMKCNTKSTSGRQTLYFLDDDNLTAQYRRGNWFFQKFENEEQITEIHKRLGELADRQEDNSYRLHIKKTRRISQRTAIESLRREWSLMLPDGQQYELADVIEDAYKRAIKTNERQR